MSIYYVYMYIDPSNNKPFYIGKGSGKRAYSHLNESKETTENYLKWCKIQSLLKKNTPPIIEIVFETFSENEAYNKEAELIQKYGRKEFESYGILANRCIDNRPPTYSGKLPRSDEYRKNMSLAKRGSKNPAYGRAPWNKDKPGYSTSKKGQKRKWITNNIISKQILLSEDVPEGWKQGRHSNGLLGIKRGSYKYN